METDPRDSAQTSGKKKLSEKERAEKWAYPEALKLPQVVVLQTLQGTQGSLGKTFKINKARVVIGSVVSADVRLMGDGVAPLHAILEVTEDEQSGEFFATVFDLASDTGVFVNDQKVITQRLKKEDVLVIGRHQLKYRLDDLSAHQKERTREIEGRTLFLNPKEELAPLLLLDQRDVEEIFDYRPTSKQALEGVMSWSGAILAVEHFVNRKKITLGSLRTSDFGIPSFLGQTSFDLITEQAGSQVLHLDSQMKGVIQKSGALQSIEQVYQSGLREIPLGKNDFVKVSLHEIDFYFSFTAAPPRLKRRKIFERDAFFSRIFSISALMTALILYTLTQVRVKQTIEVEQVPERIATILYQPEKFMRPQVKPAPKPTPTPTPTPTKKAVEPQKQPKPKPTVQVIVKHNAAAEKKPIHQVMDVGPEAQKPKPSPKVKPVSAQATQAQSPRENAKSGEGAKAKGASGSRGDSKLQASGDPRKKMSRPSSRSGDSGASGSSQVVDEANVDFLKGAGGQLQNILGNSAAQMGKGGKVIQGFAHSSSGGTDGLAISGSAKGGGGDADAVLGGLGKRGSGMGRVGTGKGAAGTGTGTLGTTARVSIEDVEVDETVVMGSVDRDAIDAAIQAHRDEFRLCYEREINAEHPTLSGRVIVKMELGASGRITHAGIEKSSIQNINCERCIIQVLKRIDFPKPRGGGVVNFTYPFNLNEVAH
ncbi:MAG: AgmX/PglI C-terminal domain-containing protein [Bdellovibrionia bacterium]